MITSKNKKIYLCSVERENIEQLRNWRNMPELRKYFREYREISKDAQVKWYEEKVLGDKNQVNFEIHDNESGKLIGHCGLYYVKWINRTGEFGIYIGDNDFRGKGYGKEALETLINYGFNNLNLLKIWAEVFGNNSAIHLYKKLGFKQEGILRKNVYKEGEHLDSILIGLLKEEWKVPQKTEPGEKKQKTILNELIDMLPEEGIKEAEKELEDLVDFYKKLKNTIAGATKKADRFIPKKRKGYY